MQLSDSPIGSRSFGSGTTILPVLRVPRALFLDHHDPPAVGFARTCAAAIMVQCVGRSEAAGSLGRSFSLRSFSR